MVFVWYPDTNSTISYVEKAQLKIEKLINQIDELRENYNSQLEDLRSAYFPEIESKLEEIDRINQHISN